MRSFDTKKYRDYLAILAEELVPALGCTEPACLALAGAKLREVLGAIPDQINIKMSGNLIKNTKSVTIPQSNGMQGIAAAVLLGVVGGDAKRGLEVLSVATEEDILRTEQLLADDSLCNIELLHTPAKLHLVVEGVAEEDHALVEILHLHTNIVRVVKNGQVLLDTGESAEDCDAPLTGRACLNVRDILAFADCVRLEEIEPILRPQIECNTAIAKQGLAGDYGANVGRSLLRHFGSDVSNLARATAAAGSDARMSGCQMPVVINSGSGNQGITSSVPVIVYAHHYGISDEGLLRALCVSNLITIHQKTNVGRLSAYCGAVSAACGSGAAITYMLGGDYEQVSCTITNTLANVSGIICDGAKPSCAAKIASSVEAAIMAHTLALESRTFKDGEGIVKSNVEETIDGVRHIASQGMRETDITVLDIVIRN